MAEAICNLGQRRAAWGMTAEAPGYRHERLIFGLNALKTRRRSLLQIAVCVVFAPPFSIAQEIRTVSPVSQTQANDFLLVSQVVANLVARNAERAKELESYTGRRTYRLEYHGFPGNLQSQMIVKVVYRARQQRNLRSFPKRAPSS